MRRRSFLAATLASASSLRAADTLEAFGMKWSVPLLHDWRLTREDNVEVLELLTPRRLEEKPRRPYQFALAQTEPLAKFTFECEVRREARKSKSLLFVYAWEDPAHFNYIHLSYDSATEQPVHNGVFHVYGGDRVRISPDKGPCALPTAGWHKLRVVYNASAGLVEAWIDGAANPSLRAADLSLGAGLVGIGSFFDTGCFRNVTLTR
jgi:hypothetical protein